VRSTFHPIYLHYLDYNFLAILVSYGHFAVGREGADGGRWRRPSGDQPGQTLAGNGQREYQASRSGDDVAAEQLDESEHVDGTIAPVARSVQRQLETHLHRHTKAFNCIQQ